MTPRDCPRYDRCSANVCPLDQDWRRRLHVRGDEVCFVLLESVKADAAANFLHSGWTWLLEVARPVADDASLPDDIRRTLERASLTGSRIANSRKAGERLRQTRLAPKAAAFDERELDAQ